MADDVHVHNPPEGGGGGPGWIVALVAVVLLVVVVWAVFLRGGTDTGPSVPDEVQVDINAPAPPGGGNQP
ncbi:MAG TPA: hypothetical protein VK929_15270 [Longimicrobiales bacterium]|nr:hypothetical protein [Longimicrobiales bacterium]